MKHELELKLFHKYPKILRDCGGDPRQTCMAFWFDNIGDGWYDLIDEIFGKVQYLCDLFTKENGSEIQVVSEQQKEKMRYYCFYHRFVGGTDIQKKILSDIINYAEHKSGHICEETGDYGVACRRGSWYKTLSRKPAFELGYIACDINTQKYWDGENAKEGLTK